MATTSSKPDAGLLPAQPLQSGPGALMSLPRLRDTAAPFLSAGSFSRKAHHVPQRPTHRGEWHGWSHRWSQRRHCIKSTYI